MIFAKHETEKKSRITLQDLHRLQATFYVAKKMGARLERSQILQRQVQIKQE